MKNKSISLLAALFVTFSLTGCGKSQHSHEFTELIAKQNATCVESGMQAHYLCSCGKYFDINRSETTLEALVIDALGHSYDDSWEVDNDPTCLGKGQKHKDCLRCGQEGRITDEVDALGHNLVLVDKLEATCTVAGHQAYYQCSRPGCGLYSVDADGNQVIENINTWLAEGGNGYIAPTGSHTYEERPTSENLKTAATCTEAAVYYKSCSCGLKSEDQTFTYGESLGHNYGKLVQKVNKTCTENGLDAHYYCDRCSTYFTTSKVATTLEDLVIPAGHEISYVDAKDANYDEDGHIGGYVCGVCNNHYYDEAGTNPIADPDWTKTKLAFTEALDKTLFIDLSVGDNGALDTVETGLDGYSYLNSDLSPVSWENKVAGDTFTCFAAKNGETSYKVSVLVVTKVLYTADDLLALNAVTAGADTIEGYFVLGSDITGFASNVKWQDDCHSKAMVGTLDGRNHSVVNGSVSGTAGIFGARRLADFTLKNISFPNFTSGSYGLLGYQFDNLTAENVTIEAKDYQHTSTGLLNLVNGATFTNCTFDNTANNKAFINDVKNSTFNNVTVKGNYHSPLFNKYNGNAYETTYSEDIVTWVFNDTYTHINASSATFEEGAHGEGYYCSVCEKYFANANHTNEIASADWYTSDKITSTKVEGVELFYNLATKALITSEAPSLDASKLVDSKLSTPSYTGLVAGDLTHLYVVGETTYEYDVRVVTDVIATEADYATKLNASSSDLSGYFVLTNDLGTTNTVNAGSHTNQTNVNVVVDGRNHTISKLVVRNSTGGMFGSCGYNKNYNVTFKNFIISSVSCAAYGMFGYYPGISNGGVLTIDNCDFTASGTSNRYGLISATSYARMVIKNSTFDFTQNDFSGGQEVYSGSYLFGAGARASFENCKMIIIEAHDTYKNNFTEGGKEYVDVVRPDAIVKDKQAEERDGLTSKISGMTFLTARP